MKTKISLLLLEFKKSITPRNYEGVFKIPLTPRSKEEEDKIKKILIDGDFTHEEMAKLYVMMKEIATIYMMLAISEIQRKKPHDIPTENNIKIITPFPLELLKNKNKTLVRNILFVEDKYEQIYKISWLKLRNIVFNIDDFDTVFSEKSDFIIFGLEGAGAVSGLLRSKNSRVYDNHKIIGLFDFDKEGGENFHHLKRDKYWDNEILGSKNSCHYRKRNDHPNWYAMLLPVPDRIKHLADLEYENFASYIEVENLLPEKFLTENNFVTEKKAVGTTSYLKIKEKVKSTLWEKATQLKKEDFIDFSPIFDKINELILDGRSIK